MTEAPTTRERATIGGGLPAGAHRIVVVGGGIAGIILATRLGRRIGRRFGGTGQASITLADRAFAHTWKPMLHSFAAGTAEYHNESLAFADHALRNGYAYVPGTLAGLDRAARTVTLSPTRRSGGAAEMGGATLGYDTLVLAVGSRADDFGTPGVAEQCHFIGDIVEAEKFNDAMRTAATRALSANVDLRVAIVGGGSTGVELAAELSSASDMLAAYLPKGSPRKLRIVLVESGSRLLAALPERVSAAARTRLSDLGIEVLLGSRVVSADRSGYVLDGDRRVDADLLVWTAGIRAPAVLDGLGGLETSKSGQIVVGPTLQTTRDPAIFALGDCMSLRDPHGKPVPATAQAARQQAVFLARGLSRALRFGRPMRPFRFTDFGSIVSLGGYTAYGALGRHGLFPGTFIEGRMAQLAHRALYRAHQLDLNGVVRGSMLWLADDLRRAVRPGVRID